MAARKSLTNIEYEEQLERIAALSRRGYSQQDISKKVGLSQPQVSLHLKTIIKRYSESMENHYKALVYEKTLQYKEIRREAWEAYDRSKRKTKKIVERFAYEYTEVDEHGEELDPSEREVSEKRIERIVTREGRLPDDAFLNVILKTLKDEREMLGLDEAVKVDLHLTGKVDEWLEAAQGIKENPIDAEFKVLQNLPDISLKEKAAHTGNGVNGNGTNGTNGSGKSK